MQDIEMLRTEYHRSGGPDRCGPTGPVASEGMAWHGIAGGALRKDGHVS